MFLISFNIGMFIFLNMFMFFWVLVSVKFCGVVIIIEVVSGICCVIVSWILFVFGGIFIIK